MEEHDLAARLRGSRERLRALLVPERLVAHAEADVFPRSALMQLLLDPGARRLAMTLLPVLLMIFGRRRAPLRLWPQLTQSISVLAAMARR